MSPQLAAAEARAAEARDRLHGTMATLQTKLEPRAIAREAMDSGQQALQSGVQAAARNPGAVAGAGALLVAFLARRRIASLVGRLRNRKATDAPGARSPSHRRPDAGPEDQTR